MGGVSFSWDLLWHLNLSWLFLNSNKWSVIISLANFFLNFTVNLRWFFLLFFFWIHSIDLWYLFHYISNFSSIFCCFLEVSCIFSWISLTFSPCFYFSAVQSFCWVFVPFAILFNPLLTIVFSFSAITDLNKYCHPGVSKVSLIWEMVELVSTGGFPMGFCLFWREISAFHPWGSFLIWIRHSDVPFLFS